MIRNIRERNGAFLYPVLLSLLIHLLIFVGVSLDILWPKGVSAKKLIPIRIVSVDQPKLDKRLPPNPDSRFLSDANRRESGAGKPSSRPRLRREREDRVPARRGAKNPAVASLAPPPSPQVLPQPRPTPPAARKTAPPKPRAEEPSRTEMETPRPESKEQEKTAPAPVLPARQKVKPSPPNSIEKARPAPAAEKSAAAEKPVRKKVKKRAEKAGPEVKVTRRREKTKRPKLVKKKNVEKPKKKKPLEIASLPKPREQIKPKPARRTAPRQPADPLAIFRTRSTPRGMPDAPKLKLSDEDADRLAKASLDEDLKEEEGEIVSLDTRDVRYAAYFAYLKRKIRDAWDPYVSKYTGRVKLKFVLLADGSLRRWELLSSSGYRILDDAAISAVSEPKFKPFPPELRAKKKILPIEGIFIYERRGGLFSP